MKAELLNKLLAKIEDELAHTENAARDAASYATDEEAKATSKWDTQGLEASYLAAGQAKKVAEMRDDIARLQALKSMFETDHANIREGSLVTVSNAGEKDLYLIVPAGGGTEIETETGDLVWCLTPQSPLGQRLIGKTAGAEFVLPNGARASIETVD